MMRLADARLIPAVHSALTNVGIDQHHERPSVIETSNTSLVVAPLPGGPGVWDIAMPFNAEVVMVALRSPRTVAEGSGKAGVVGIASRNILETSCVSIGGYGGISQSAEAAVYTKRASAQNLSHKVFDGTLGGNVSLTSMWLNLTGPSTRVLRTFWTNYSASNKTLKCWAEIAVLR